MQQGIKFYHIQLTLTCYIKKFRSSNSRSELFNMISILKCAWRPNFIFFGIFLLFIKYFTKLLFLDNSEPMKTAVL